MPEGQSPPTRHVHASTRHAQDTFITKQELPDSGFTREVAFERSVFLELGSIEGRDAALYHIKGSQYAPHRRRERLHRPRAHIIVPSPQKLLLSIERDGGYGCR